MRAVRRCGALVAALVIGGGALVAAPIPALAAIATTNGIVVNEVESSGGEPGDWFELRNTTDAAVDLGGLVVKDDQDDNTFTIPAGTVIDAGGYLVFDQLQDDGSGHFDFGLGKADTIRLFEADGTTLITEVSWEAHGDPTWGLDADGNWAQTAESTKGGENVFTVIVPETPGSLVLNEVDSGPADWVEFVNPGTEALDISGYEIRDNSDDHRWRFPAGSSIAPGEHLVVDAKTEGLIWDQRTDSFVPNTFEAAIGIGSADSIRVYDAAGALLDETSWNGHANIDGDESIATIGRYPDATGAFQLTQATPGAENIAAPSTIVINEVESNGDAVGDWAEITNTGTEPVDISGWTLIDNDPVGHAADVTPVPAGTVLAPGDYYVFLQNTDFTFGLGNNDSVTVRDAAGASVATYEWAAHAAGVYARCADGVGEFRDVEVSSRGAANVCGNPVVLNEVESSGGEPGDWIELTNPTANPLDIGGLVVKDSDDAHAYTIPAGTTIAPGAFFVIEEAELGFGLGGTDAVRIFEGELVVQETSWEGHAATSWGRCASANGAFLVTAEPTKGAVNACVGDVPVQGWAGGDPAAVDTTPTFLEDTSGLEFQAVDGRGVLWVVDNGTGSIWKLDVAADGTFTQAWTEPKRVRFQHDADNPAAAGPDAEGITIADNGLLYIASERDNSDKGVNQNIVLMVDPTAGGPDLVAEQEWNLTEALPAVSANTGIETIEWVADDVLAGRLWDASTGAAYDPANYPANGGGLFFVGVENDGLVYAFALGTDGSISLVTTLDPKLGGVMALDYDPVLGVLWALCDDGCEGLGAQFAFNGTDTASLVHVTRPASMPNVNNEGFAVSTLCVDGVRTAWWAEDGVAVNALRAGTLPCAVEQPTTPPTGTEQPTEPGQPAQPGEPTTSPSTGADAPAVGHDDAAKPTAPGLAQTGAGDLTWILVIAGVLVVAGVALFVVRARGTAEKPTADSGE